MLIDTVLAISDAEPAPVPAVLSFPGSDAAGWAALDLSGLDAEGRFSPNLGCFLLRRPGCTVLCDLGIGPGPSAYLDGLTGRLPDVLAAEGLAPADIDAVIFTHLHMDHVGWATRAGADGRRVATFPRADYFVAEPEYAFWASGAPGAKPHHVAAFDTAFRPLLGLGRLFPVVHGETILPGMRLLATPGHTPGHAAILFEPERLVIAGDIFHCPGQIERPEWGHRADMDPDAARDTRRAFLRRSADEGWTVGCGHFRDGLQLGHIAAAAAGFRFVPAAGMPTPADRPHHPVQQGRLQ